MLLRLMSWCGHQTVLPAPGLQLFLHQAPGLLMEASSQLTLCCINHWTEPVMIASRIDWCDNTVQVANTRVPAVSAQLLVNGAFRDMTKVSGQSTA